MSIEKYQFIDNDSLIFLAKQILAKSNVRVDEYIDKLIDESSTDKKMASAKAIYTLITAINSTHNTIAEKLDSNDTKLGVNGDKISSILEDQSTQDNKLNEIEIDINDLNNVVDALIHIEFDVYTGLIENITEPRENVLYIQRDSASDPTWMIYVYIDGKWINVGDTELDLSNYWKKTDITEMREALLNHEIESITDDEITSLIDEAFVETRIVFVYHPLTLTSDNLYMVGYNSDQYARQNLVVPERFITPDNIGYEVVGLSRYAFENVDNIVSLTLPGTIKSIPAWALSGMTRLKSVTLCEGIQYIGDVAFQTNTALESIVIPDSVTSTGTSVFRHCQSLKTVDIGNGLKTINRTVFSDCTSLETVIIGKGLTKVSDVAFYECRNIKTIYYRGTEEEWNNISIGTDRNYSFLTATKVFNYEG